MRHTRVAEDFVEASCEERIPVMDEKSPSSQEAIYVVNQGPGQLNPCKLEGLQ